jgi:hypothetical protein
MDFFDALCGANLCVFAGFLRSCVYLTWYLAGEFVVIRMVNVVSSQRVFWEVKIRQRVELYFSSGSPENPFFLTNTKAQWLQPSSPVYPYRRL